MQDEHYTLASASTGYAADAMPCPDCKSIVLVTDHADHQDWHSRARVGAITIPAALPEPGQPA
jgi:hypothetical protein